MPSFSRLFYFLISVIFITMSTAGRVAAQPATPIFFPLPKENYSLKGAAAYALSEKGVTDFKIISSLSFVPLSQLDTDSFPALSDAVESAWTHFIIKNTLPLDTVVMLKVGPQARRVIIYEQQMQLLKEAGRSGMAMPYSQLSEKDGRRIKILLKANATQSFYLRQQRHGLSNSLDIPELQSQTQAIIEKSKVDNDQLPLVVFTLLMIGFQFAIFIFSFIKYNNQQQDKAYLWYGLSNLLTCIFVLADGNAIVLDSFLWNNLNQADYFLFFNIVSSLVYLKFQVEILQLNLMRPKLVKSMKIYAAILMTGAFLFLIADQLRIFPMVYSFTRAFSIGIFIYVIAIFLYLKNNRTGFNKYLYYGILSMIIGGSFYIPYIWFDLRRFLPPLIRGNFIMGVPTAVELCLFLKALVYRDQETEREKIRYQQRLIEQMEYNRELQLSFTKNLENQVKERTAELLEQRKMMEQEREEKLRAEFERRFSESELKALRSQINPHFIFNVLNTIESFALENNTDAASDMIQKFSRLTRLVLENSLYLVVPIENDLEALKLYIELEQIRYHDKFSSCLQIEREVSEGSYCIPPMIIQPYVENAILHGLRNLSSNNGVLKIDVSIQYPYVKIAVEDNGVGREQAAALKKNEVIRRIPIGMSVTQDRISIFNNLSEINKAAVNIYDLQNGTRVELKFPLDLAAHGKS